MYLIHHDHKYTSFQVKYIKLFLLRIYFFIEKTIFFHQAMLFPTRVIHWLFPCFNGSSFLRKQRRLRLFRSDIQNCIFVAKYGNKMRLLPIYNNEHAKELWYLWNYPNLCVVFYLSIRKILYFKQSIFYSQIYRYFP